MHLTAAQKNRVIFELFSTEKGKVALGIIENDSGLLKQVFRPSINGNAPYDAIQAALTEGERKLFIKIRNRIDDGRIIHAKGMGELDDAPKKTISKNASTRARTSRKTKAPRKTTGK